MMEKFMIVFFSIFGIIGIGILIGFYHIGEPVMLVVGMIFSLVGWGVVIPLVRKRIIQRRVRARGVAIDTTFMEVIRSDVSMNNHQGYIVRTQWLDVDKNILYYFSSNTLWYDPTEILKDIRSITVLVNPNNFYQNYMDLTFLPDRHILAKGE